MDLSDSDYSTATLRHQIVFLVLSFLFLLLCFVFHFFNHYLVESSWVSQLWESERQFQANRGTRILCGVVLVQNLCGLVLLL